MGFIDISHKRSNHWISWIWKTSGFVFKPRVWSCTLRFLRVRKPRVYIYIYPRWCRVSFINSRSPNAHPFFCQFFSWPLVIRANHPSRTARRFKTELSCWWKFTLRHWWRLFPVSTKRWSGFHCFFVTPETWGIDLRLWLRFFKWLKKAARTSTIVYVMSHVSIFRNKNSILRCATSSPHKLIAPLLWDNFCWTCPWRTPSLLTDFVDPLRI